MPKQKLYVRGDASKAQRSRKRGWVIGRFCEGLAYTENHEVKLWRYDVRPNYPPKVFPGHELIIVYRGVLILKLWRRGRKRSVRLSGAGQQYILLSPGIKKQVIAQVTPVYGVTVRWPSK